MLGISYIKMPCSFYTGTNSRTWLFIFKLTFKSRIASPNFSEKKKKKSNLFYSCFYPQYCRMQYSHMELSDYYSQDFLNVCCISILLKFLLYSLLKKSIFYGFIYLLSIILNKKPFLGAYTLSKLLLHLFCFSLSNWLKRNIDLFLHSHSLLNLLLSAILLNWNHLLDLSNLNKNLKEKNKYTASIPTNSSIIPTFTTKQWTLNQQ